MNSGLGDYTSRLKRIESLLTTTRGAAREPLRLLGAVVAYQATRFADIISLPSTLPVDMTTIAAHAARELPVALAVLADDAPPGLAATASSLGRLRPGDATQLAATWLEEPETVDPAAGFWLQASTGPILERLASDVTAPSEWQTGTCPLCGAPAQHSLIAEETGEFMGGSPRRLVCGRCALSWRFPRATCPTCGEDDSSAIRLFTAVTRQDARIDVCTTCTSYIKTFDLRRPGGRDLIAPIDDVATLTLDLWAHQQGFRRSSPSFAGA